MKKIALFIPSLKNGGAERVVSIWASELSKLSDRICLIVLYKAEQEYETYGDVEKIYLYESYAQSKQGSTFSKIIKIRSVLKEKDIDVVIPFVYHAGILASLACLCLKTKVVETLRADPYKSPGSRILRAARNISVRLSKRVIVQNEDQKAYFGRRVQRKMTVFANPLHPSTTQTHKEYKATSPITFMTAGRLEKQKNHKLLCDAFKIAVKECPDIELKIYGTGSMQAELCTYIEKLGMQDKINMCGRTDDMAGTLLNADAFVLPSDFEGMPNALMEAMAVGLPCISTNCPTGPSDMIVSGKNGILVPVGNAESMAEAIIRIANNYDIAIEMGREARTFALEKYEASASAKRLLTFIENI